MKCVSTDRHYRTRVITSLSDIGKEVWSRLLLAAKCDDPFLQYAFLNALHQSGSAIPETGWQEQHLTIWDGQELVAACLMYSKSHSYGEYVFDWAWARAYQQHQLAYYPKLLSAVPFSPIPGPRLLATDEPALHMLLAALRQLCESGNYSSCHVLFLPEGQQAALAQAGFLCRQGIQFHWENQDYQSFDDFLLTLDKKRRKNIRSERKKVQERGFQFQHLKGSELQEAHWLFFKRCYDLTYRNHHSSPYLNLDFFLRLGAEIPAALHMVIASLEGQPVAAALFLRSEHRLYGRYWGCVEDHPCLHFETAYYQGLDLCIREGIQWFEGGAQGEHKLARGFQPETTYSAHYIHHPGFRDAIQDFLNREEIEMQEYRQVLLQHQAYRHFPSQEEE